MSNNDRRLLLVWLIQTAGREGPDLWIVGSNTADEAIDMVGRNIGQLITGMRQVENEAHIVFGELRMARASVRFEP